MMKARHSFLVFAAIFGALGTTRPTSALAFEKIAYIDSFDYPEYFETETAEGSVRILDNVLKTGATTILWRNQSGAIPRYPSAEEALPLKEPPLDKRRIPLSEPIRGWVRFDGCGTNLIQVAADECARRGVTFGIHMTTEENHGESWTLSPWNLEHPQFWCCARGGVPWPGRCSLAYDEVLAHKLRLVDELLAMKPAMIYIDLRRAGGWGPNLEFVTPMENEWRKLYNCEPPANWRDSRWLALVEKYVYRYVAGIRERIERTGRRVELVMAIERAGEKEDYDYVYRAVDWRKMLRMGVIDSVAVACVTPDWKDPWGSTARIYGGIVREVRGIGRGKVYFPIMSYNFANRPGYGEYAKQTGISNEQAVQRLLELARDAGGDGITMEVVDFNNYSPAVCKAIREFGL